MRFRGLAPTACASPMGFRRESACGLPQVDRAAVDGIGTAGDKPGFIAAQVQRQGGDFLGLGHAADGLGFAEFLEHLGFLAGSTALLNSRSSSNEQRRDDFT